MLLKFHHPPHITFYTSKIFVEPQTFLTFNYIIEGTKRQDLKAPANLLPNLQLLSGR